MGRGSPLVNYWKNLKPGPNPPDIIYVVVEVPRGSRNKYEYDTEHGVFYLNRVLGTAFHYECDYGFIPQTLCEDEGPLDAMVLTDRPTFPGCVIQARPVCLMHMIDTERVDDKILAVPVGDPRYNEVKEIKDLGRAFMSSAHIIKELTHFFNHYKDLEGKRTEVLEWKEAGEAKKRIVEAVQFYKQSKGRRKSPQSS